ncbi:MAG: hypothetical protein ACRBBO_03175 [Cognatishimia sp.]|uniref:hypothetical protein n=1 Tax=Cognatishimia sp. 1_MG-2023 TaxID=3062642 RepID=UPI0026E359CF|nr:hypothetical protein [Cognatishimia sp. 1_MG-2023]MDO6728115.1 hypothetical protein [Cognatishimia sp. 1_MG-2023]
MKNALIISLSALALSFATAAMAQDCYADYKAKQNDPLRLHYGVAQVQGECSKSNAQGELTPRLRSGGWVLLNVLSVFDSSGLDQRKADAGQFYLRY